MKIIFAGTPEFAVAPLQTIAAEHSITAVFTQPDRKAGRGKKLTAPPVKLAAEQLGIPVYQPNTLKDQTEFIASHNPDVMVVVAYGMILPQAILDIPRLGCINIHASLLPRWRGAAPIQRAIEAGDQQTGVSIMRMELGLDTGPVYQMLHTDISADDTSATLHDRLSELGAEGINQTLRKLTSDPGLTPTEQDHTQANYAKKISKEEAIIDWTLSAQQIDCKLRAFIPWPGCQTHYQGTRLRIWRAAVLDAPANEAAGTIVRCDDAGLEVACGKGILRLEVLQRDGSKPLPFKEFRHGFALSPGDRLG